MTRPRSDLEALRVDLRAAYNGDPWHGPSITGVLEGITAETAGQPRRAYHLGIGAAHGGVDARGRIACAGRRCKESSGGLAKREIRWRRARLAGRQGRIGGSAEGARTGRRGAQARRSHALDRRPARPRARYRLAGRDRGSWTAAAPRLSRGSDLAPQACDDQRATEAQGLAARAAQAGHRNFRLGGQRPATFASC